VLALYEKTLGSIPISTKIKLKKLKIEFKRIEFLNVY
jgi:hypothetical protein